MDDSFLAYLQRLELIAFFSGYPLIYTIVLVIAGNRESRTRIKTSFVSFLPYAYALLGTLYLGMVLKNLYPDYSIEAVRQSIYHPFLVAWALLGIFFWIPALARRPFLSLLHSLVFLFLLVKDLFFPGIDSDRNLIRNEMKLYTDSLLWNLAAFAAIALIYFLISWFKKTRSNTTTQ